MPGRSNHRRERKPRRGAMRLLAAAFLIFSVATMQPEASAQAPPVPPTFTGNAQADFNFVHANLVTATDPSGDVGMPGAFAPGTISGWDIRAVSFYYHVATDTLYVGIDCIGVCGDVDGDGNPGGTSATLAGLGGVDRPNLSNTETVALLLDTDNDFVSPGNGDFDFVVGVGVGPDVSSFNIYQFTGDPLNPGFGFGGVVAGHTATLFASPSAASPDIEFTINSFSTLSGFTFTPGQFFRFKTSYFAGSVEDDGIGEENTPSAGQFADVPVGAIDIEKATNGQDADAPTGPSIAVGGTVTWTYVVRNIGDLALSSVVIIDDNGTPGVTADDFTVVTGETLAVGQTKTFTRTGVAVAGQYANIGRVTASASGNQVVRDQDPSHYFGVVGTVTPSPSPTPTPTPTPPPAPPPAPTATPSPPAAPPSVSLQKATNGQDANLPPGPTLRVGDPVTWTYTVTNGGDTRLTNVTVTDDNGTPGDPSDDFIVISGDVLAIGQVRTYAYRGVVRVAGQYGNLARVTTAEGVNASDPSHYFARVELGPAVRLIKRTNGEVAPVPPGPSVQVGGRVTWTYSVTNTGGVPLTNVTVVDDAGTPANPADDVTVTTGQTLAVGEQKEFQLTGVARAGQYVNNAVVTTREGPRSTDLSHYVGRSTSPGIRLVKLTNGEDANVPPGPSIQAGTPVTWTYVVTNTGAVRLTNVTIVDDSGTPANRSDDVTVAAGGTLEVGQRIEFRLTGTARAGQYANVARATTAQGVQSTDPSHYFGEMPPSLSVRALRGCTVPGATVTIQRLTRGLWSSADPGAREDSTGVINPAVNPQVSDARGAYSWNVVPGVWRIVVTHPSYDPAASGPIQVAARDVELSPLGPVEGCQEPAAVQVPSAPEPPAITPAPLGPLAPPALSALPGAAGTGAVGAPAPGLGASAPSLGALALGSLLLLLALGPAVRGSTAAAGMVTTNGYDDEEPAIAPGPAGFVPGTPVPAEAVSETGVRTSRSLWALVLGLLLVVIALGSAVIRRAGRAR